MKSNDIKFSHLSNEEQTAMIELFRDNSRSVSKEVVPRSKSPIEDKIKRGQITGIASNAVKRALEIQNGPRIALDKAVVNPAKAYVSPSPIVRNLASITSNQD